MMCFAADEVHSLSLAAGAPPPCVTALARAHLIAKLGRAARRGRHSAAAYGGQEAAATTP